MDRYSLKFQKSKTKQQTKMIGFTELHKSILDEVIKIKRFSKHKVIEADKFSSTIAVENGIGENMAVKIVSDDNLGENEKLWEILQQHHVLPVLNYEYLPNPKAHLFYTVVPSYTLKDLVSDKKFKTNTDAIRKITKWFKEAAAGFQYLHESGYKHLNISSENIVITKDGTAKIKNFHYLQHGNKRLIR